MHTTVEERDGNYSTETTLWLEPDREIGGSEAAAAGAGEPPRRAVDEEALAGMGSRPRRLSHPPDVERAGFRGSLPASDGRGAAAGTEA